MKLNLPPKIYRPTIPNRLPTSRPDAVAPEIALYRHAEEAARRKQAILVQIEQRRATAKAAVRAAKLGVQLSPR